MIRDLLSPSLTSALFEFGPFTLGLLALELDTTPNILIRGSEPLWVSSRVSRLRVPGDP